MEQQPASFARFLASIKVGVTEGDIPEASWRQVETNVMKRAKAVKGMLVHRMASVEARPTLMATTRGPPLA
jgi:hypothetical protein